MMEEPRLRDRRLASGRAARSRRLPWFGLLVLAVLLLQALSFANTAKLHTRAIGVDLEELEEGVFVVQVEPGGPADRVGIRTGDRVHRVSGREVETFVDYDEAASTFLPRARVDFQIEREQYFTVQLIPGQEFPWLKSVIELLAGLGYLALAGIAMVQLPNDLRARLLMWMSIAVAFELALPLDILDLPVFVHFSYPLVALLVGLQISTELHLAASIPDRRRFETRRAWMVPLFYVLGLGSSLIVALSLIADSFGSTALPWSLELAETLFWGYGGILWAVTVVVLLATAAAKSADPLSRQQTLLVLLAGLPWSLYILGIEGTQLVVGSTPAWTSMVEPLVLLAYPLAVLVAIFRFQLFDLELIVRRGLVYGTLTGLLVLVFYASIGLGGAFLSSFMPGGQASVWAVGVATLLMGLLFLPLRRATQRQIDRRFFPERGALRERLIQLASDLPARGSLPAMGDQLAREVTDMFGLESASVVLAAKSGTLTTLATCGVVRGTDVHLMIGDGDPAIRMLATVGRPLPLDHLATKSPSLAQKLKALNAAILVPLQRRDQLIGIMVLGRKLGGRPFPAEEMELLNLLSRHAATAFEYSQLYESATRDSLTGLLRRGAVLEAVSRELDRSLRFGRPMALAMADIDRFKEVNDRHGHLKGDLMLRRVAEAMTAGMRVTDQIGRYGGEELLIVLPETDSQGVHVVAEKLRELVEGVSAEADNGEEIRVTISIGVVAIDQFPAGSRPDVNDLIAVADEALYQAKSLGRNRVETRAAAG